jgi:hypothetical protein
VRECARVGGRGVRSRNFVKKYPTPPCPVRKVVRIFQAGSGGGVAGFRVWLCVFVLFWGVVACSGLVWRF